MKAEIKTITPEIAKEILSRNSANRTIRKDRVKDYSNQMKAGKWNLTGQGITISKEGQLLDGQHRLNAIIDANVSIPMLLVTDADNVPTYDNGLSRSLLDQLRIMHGNISNPTYSNYGISFFRLFAQLIKEGTIESGKKREPLDVYALEDLMVKAPTELHCYLAYCSSIRKSAVGISGMSKVVIPVSFFSIYTITDKFSYNELIHITDVFYSGIPTQEERDILIIRARNKVIEFLSKRPCSYVADAYLFRMIQLICKCYLDKKNLTTIRCPSKDIWDFSTLKKSV